jgi:protein CpxP
MLEASQPSPGSQRSCPLATYLSRRVLGLTLCLAAVISIPLAQAQDSEGQGMKYHGHHQRPSVDDQVKHMTKALNLTTDQQSKVRNILEEQRKQMDQLRADSSLSQDARFGKMHDIHQNSSTQIKALLNPDQQQKFDQMEQERRDRMMRREGGNGHPEGYSGDRPQSNQ